MNLALDKALLFADRSEWRRWLEKNHAKEKVALLIHYRKDSGKQTLSHFEAVEEAICFGWIDSILRRIDDERFVLKYTPRKANSVWSKINRDKAEQLIKTGLMTEAGLAKIAEAKKNGQWDNAYTNKVRDEIPTDLEEALKHDKKALQNFQQFANSYRNMYIGWVTGAKTKATREKRINEVVRRSLLKIKPE
ncbi:MAG: YdeI/OmpD-associated family protein [Dehalococcoidales bacterium]|nr:YdeI/OmpD-associated family protein [Dehalococcoidales bacterium]